MKIINLKTVPNVDLVNTLRALLSDAEEGRIQGMAFVLLDDSATISHGWSGIVDQNANATLGGVTVLQSRLVYLAADVT